MNKFQSKKIKKAPRENVQRPTLHLPFTEMSPVSSVIGTIARTAALWLGIFGLALFIAEAFGLVYTEQYETLPSGMVVLRGTSGYITSGTMLLSAAIASIVLAVGLYSRYTAFVAPIGVLAYVLHLSITFGNIALALENMLRRAVNEIMTQMAAHGFFQFSEYRLSDSYSYDPSLLMKEAVILLIFALSALVFAFMFKRVRIVPSCILVMLIIVPIFVYNISRSTFGFAFVLVFIFAALVMWLFDVRYGKRAIEHDERLRKKAENKAARADKKSADKETKQAVHNALFDTYLANLTESGSKSSARKARAAEKKKIKKAARARARAAAADKADKIAARRREQAESKKKRKELAVRLRKLPKASPERAALEEQLNSEKAQKKNAAKAKRQQSRERSSQKRATAAASGLAGITALAIAFVAVIAPYQIAKRDFPILDQIEKFMYYTRDYVTTLLTGDDVDLNEMSLYRELSELAPRKISLEPRDLTDTRLYTVRSGYNSPVYLRTWVASDYSIDESEWTSADYTDIKAYRMIFGNDFTPDSITSEFYHMMFPEGTKVNDTDHYESFAKYGFIMHQTNVTKLADTDRLLPLPSIHDSLIGILKYDSLLPTTMKYSEYYDGVISSSRFKKGDSFSVLTFSRYMKNDAAAENTDMLYTCFIAASVYYKLINTPLLGQNKGLDSDDKISQPEINQKIDRLNEQFGETLIDSYPTMTDRDEFNLFYLSAILDHYGISDELKSATVNMVLGKEFAESFVRFYELHNTYRNYVIQNYRKASGNDRISALADQLLENSGLRKISSEGGIPQYIYSDTGATATTHDVIMTVIDYFKYNFTYSLSPEVSTESSVSENVLEQFLFDTKSGYCSHFATAAAVLLREYGFAVRYCEGYIANDFKRDTDSSEALPFKTTVLESDSHAWIEVYFPAIGWVTYECTPTFIEAFYNYPQDAPSQPNPPESTDDPSESTEITPEESTTPPASSEANTPSDSTAPEETTSTQEQRNYETLQKYLRVSIILASLAIIAAISVKLADKIKKRAESAIDIRVCLINAAMSKERYDIAPRKHTREITRDLSDHILTVFSEIGYQQKVGELPTEYADRLKIKYAVLSNKDLSDIIYLIQKEEFGHGLNYDELYTLAEYLRELTAGIYPTLKWYDRIRLRYIKHVL